MFSRAKNAMKSSARAMFGRSTAGWRTAETDERRVTPSRETKSEDKILPLDKRLRLLSSARDNFRNTTFSPATAQQLKINVIGSQGGKLTLTTADGAWNESAGRWFSRWERHAEFTNGLHLNKQLQLGLVQLTHGGGDFVLIFDDGSLTGGTGSGRIRMFESDEIANISETAFKDRYGGRGWTQSNGLIYDQFGRHIGCFVSSSQRGEVEFAEGKYLTLLRDPSEPPEASFWLYVGQFWRPNQGRGIPTVAHISSAIDEMETATTAELAAAKLNAHIALKVTENQTEPASTDDIERGIANLSAGLPAPSPSDPTSTADASADTEQPIEFAMLKSGLAGVWSAPPGQNLDSFDTARPNLNLTEFIRDLKGDATTVFGLGILYATLDPQQSYTAFRGAMLMAWGTFEQMQKEFERGVLDWIGVRALEWAAARGFIAPPPEDFDTAFAWAWPTMREVNETDAQSALEKKFTNGETNLQQRHGAEWRKFVDQQSDEIRYCEEKGVTHPSRRTANGSVTEAPATAAKGTDTDKEKSNDE